MVFLLNLQNRLKMRKMLTFRHTAVCFLHNNCLLEEFVREGGSGHTAKCVLLQNSLHLHNEVDIGVGIAEIGLRFLFSVPTTLDLAFDLC